MEKNEKETPFITLLKSPGSPSFGFRLGKTIPKNIKIVY